MERDELQQVNDDYTERYKTWEYMRQSYQGGREYREGTYLRQWLKEQANNSEFNKRLYNASLHNHVKEIVNVYRGFLFTHTPKRELCDWADNDQVKKFIKDVDRNGTNLEVFMQSVVEDLMLYGTSWIITDRPSTEMRNNVMTADGIPADPRMYIRKYRPIRVIDWAFEYDEVGSRQLSYLKIDEGCYYDETKILCYFKDRIERYIVKRDGNYNRIIGNRRVDIGDIKETMVYDNPTGCIPVICARIDNYNCDLGESQLEDVADKQRAIYNYYSELMESIRLQHPTLVVDDGTEITSGVGGIIKINRPQDRNEPIFSPFLLQSNGAVASSILESINKCTESIDSMMYLSGLRSNMSQPKSGIALDAERLNLNCRLSDYATILRETELRIWNLFSIWEGMPLPVDFEVEYDKNYQIRDVQRDQAMVEKAVMVLKEINNLGLQPGAIKENLAREVLKTVIEDDMVLEQMVEEFNNDSMTGENTQEDPMEDPMDPVQQAATQI